ncbi:MAG: hypothetical protein ABR548_12035 [Actinomycetota bacterium]|nr:hypothetical protein [Actinomycetota bacterium]
MRNRVLGWAVAFLAMDLVHDLDHVRRGNYSPGPVKVLGFLALGGAILTIVLAGSRHRFAAPYAAFFGFTSAIGFVAVHVLPHWGPFSDPLQALHVDTFTWLIAAIDIVVAFGLGIAGVREMNSEQPQPLQSMP